MDERERVVGTVEAAEVVGVRPVTVRLWCRQGRIAGAWRMGRDWAIPVTSLSGLERSAQGRPQKDA